MRDVNRIEPLLNKLKELWLLYPDMRFGQLVVNLLGRDPFYVEDYNTIKIIEGALERNKDKVGD